MIQRLISDFDGWLLIAEQPWNASWCLFGDTVAFDVMIRSYERNNFCVTRLTADFGKIDVETRVLEQL